MHYAHKLLEELRPDSEDYGRVMRAVKFDLGDHDTFDATASLVTFPEFTRTPFPVCLFQASSSEGIHMWLVYNESFGGRDGVHVTCFYKNAATKMQWDHAGIHLRVFPSTESDKARMGFFSHDDSDITEKVLSNEDHAFWGGLLFDIFSVIEVFSCSNVEQLEHAAPKHLNTQRARKKKPPIFSYRTLHITGEASPKGQSCAHGDRSSPRLHLRRGHIRRLSDGRRVWVRSAVVGVNGSGFVHKDYSVRHRLSHQDQ